MCANRDKDEEQIYYHALTMPPAQRQPYLEQACGGDLHLLRRVQALLNAHDRSDSFLEPPPADPRVTLDNPARIDGPGTAIGRYELLELIGEGGMGLVYLAEQKEPVRRKVALKIIKPGMDSKQVIARFEAERQALALLDHPNVAHVFDAGTTEAGRPYFVMEYVKGRSITHYCDDNRLAIEQRLHLFLQVCEGIQYAHQKGIIHRDIKPSNILVSSQGNKAVPKVIDFGVAKAANRPLTELTLFTAQGQLIGTPEYMSPEQAELTNQDIDTRSDIYSLGVVLYELLAGALPFDSETLRSAAFDEILRIVRDQDPPRPSTRLSSLGDKASQIAANQRTDVRTLTRRLNRELEWIPMMALRKERDRRYKTVADLSEDIQNYLNGKPLMAGPESAVYRFGKTVKRYRVLAGAAAAVVLVLIAGVVVSTFFAIRAHKAEDKATESFQEANDARTEAERTSASARIASYRDRVYRSQKELMDGDYFNAYRLLASCPDDLRGWEWQHLLCVFSSAGMLIDEGSHGGEGLGGPVGFGFNKNEILLWSGEWVETRDYETHRVTSILPVRDGWDYTMVISKDGTTLASWHDENPQYVEIWDIQTQQIVRRIECNDKGYPWVELSPHGESVLIYAGNEPARIVNVKTGTSAIVDSDDDYILYCAFGEDGKTFAFEDSKRVRIWDTETHSETQTLTVNPGGIRSIAIDPSCRRLAVGHDSGLVTVWDLADGDRVMELTAGRGSIGALTFSPDGKYMAGGLNTGKVTIWDAAKGYEINTIPGRGTLIRSMEFSPDSQYILIHDFGSKGVWKVLPDDRASTLNKSHGWHLAITPQGAELCRHSDGMFSVWDVATDTARWTCPLDGSWTGGLAFSRDGRYAAVSTRDDEQSTIHVWDLQQQEKVKTFPVSVPSVSVLGFSADGTRLLAAGVTTSLGKSVAEFIVLDACRGATVFANKVKTRHGSMNAKRGVAFSPDGTHIAVAPCGDRSIKVWSVAQKDVVREIPIVGYTPVIPILDAVAFGPDGRHIVAADNNTSMQGLWDITTGKRIRAYDHGISVRAAAFSHDGARIVTAAVNGTIKIWDGATEAEFESLSLESEPGLLEIGWSADGKQLLAESEKTIEMWDSARDKDTLRLLRTVGQRHYHARQFDKAIDVLDRAIQVDPHEPQYWYQRAQCRCETGAYDKAISDLDRAITLNGDNFAYQYARADAYLKAQQYDRAIEEFSSIIGTYPRNPMYRSRRGDAYMGVAQYDLAVADFTEAIRLRPDYHESLIKRAHAYYKTGNARLAKNDLQRALQLDPNNASLCNRLAWIYATSKADGLRNEVLAVELALSACEVDGNDHNYLDTLAAAYAANGQFDMAVETQKRAVEIVAHAGKAAEKEYRARLEMYRQKKPYREE